MESPLTFAGIISATLVPLVGLVIWLGRWFTEKHVNRLVDIHKEELSELRENWRDDSKEQRALFREEMAELRGTFTAANTQLAAELKRLNDILTNQETILKSLIYTQSQQKSSTTNA